jgi:hypothetical protein
LIAAVDFSESNGDQKDPNSLHYLHPDDEHTFNVYQDALFCVANVLLDYDTDKKVPFYGFGGRVPEAGGVHGPARHAFKLSESEVDGVNELMETYKKSLSIVKLFRPTLLRPIITKAATDARETAKL